jgi:uncharacterized protein CbrC (UPF0167 family)
VNVGRTAFAIVIDRLHAGSQTPCLRCGERFRQDVATVAMKAGAEVVGYFCPHCLSDGMRERLAQAERGAVTR